MYIRQFGFLKWLAFAVMIVGSVSSTQAQTLSGAALANALRQGGFVLVMRHANAPAQPPAKADADPKNAKLERQLDAMGRDTARAMGEAVKSLRIPIGDVFSSPTFRAHQTIELAALGQPKDVTELDEGAAGMQAIPETARIAYLKAKAAELPRSGGNTIVVTHAPNIKGAFDIDAAAGETLVFKPDGKGGATQVARIKIGDWASFAK